MPPSDSAQFHLRKKFMTHIAHTIRLARVEDAAEIARINVQTWLKTYHGLIDQAALDTLSIDKRRDFWAKVITERRAQNSIFVCEARENKEGTDYTLAPTLAAYISGGLSRLSGFDAEVYALYCDPAVQAQGVGTALLMTFFGYAKEQEWKTVCVRVLSANPYKKFYYKHGAEFAHYMSERILEKDYQEEVAVWRM